MVTTNANQIPKFEKIVVNMGAGEAAGDAKAIDGAVNATSVPLLVTATLLLHTLASLSQPLSRQVQRRQSHPYDHVEFHRLIAAVPRIRDFRGIPAKGHGRGNFSMGVTEQLIFPEIDFDKMTTPRYGHHHCHHC